MKRQIKLGILGAGKMGEALIARWIATRRLKPREIGVTAAHQSRIRFLEQRYGVIGFPSNKRLVGSTKTVLLAVKPQEISKVLREVRETIRPGQLWISIAAGASLASLYKGGIRRAIRAMPNNPLLIGEGVTGLFAPRGLSQRERHFAERLLKTAGLALWVNREADLDAVTALSGSGPAYFYTIFDSLIRAGGRLGLNQAVACELACRTAIGSARMVLQNGASPKKLCRAVTSKRGTTEAALLILKRRSFDKILQQAVGAAFRRARSIKREIEKGASHHRG